MTTVPNALTASINHERSPVLLAGEDAFDAWLHGDETSARGLLHPMPAARMRIVQEGFEKKDLLASA